MTLFSLPSDSVAVTADDCYTPRWVFDAMGLEFDLDAAAPVGGPLHVPPPHRTPHRPGAVRLRRGLRMNRQET